MFRLFQWNYYYYYFGCIFWCLGQRKISCDTKNNIGDTKLWARVIEHKLGYKLQCQKTNLYIYFYARVIFHEAISILRHLTEIYRETIKIHIYFIDIEKVYGWGT